MIQNIKISINYFIISFNEQFNIIIKNYVIYNLILKIR